MSTTVPRVKPVDVDRDARRHRQFHSARDFETSSSQIGDIDPHTPDAKRRAQLVVCSFAENATEAAELLTILGIFPGQEEWSEPSGVTIPKLK